MTVIQVSKPVKTNRNMRFDAAENAAKAAADSPEDVTEAVVVSEAATFEDREFAEFRVTGMAVYQFEKHARIRWIK